MIVGIDLAGDENLILKEGDLIHQAFEIAKSNGVPRTIHAGEATSAVEVIRAIELCDVQRIGHGYRIFCKKDDSDDFDTMERARLMIREKNVHLEMCPRSSVLLKSVELESGDGMKQHPLVDAVNGG